MDKINDYTMRVVSELYKQNVVVYRGPPYSIAFSLFFALVAFIVVQSFYLKKTYLGRNWENHRCDYIFMAGFLQPDKGVIPSEYTIQNLKYCIKQKIYNETPLLPYIKDTLRKINYLIRFLKTQVGIYESHVKEEVGNNTYNEIMLNKVNYLNYKQQKLTALSNKINSTFTKSIDKIQEGVDQKVTLDKESVAADNYLSDQYISAILNKK